MSDRMAAPPPGTHICGGSWSTMTDRARAEVWMFYDYLATGGKSAHGSFDDYRRAPSPSPATPGATPERTP